MKTYRIIEGMILSIEDNAINKMLKYCQRKGMSEAGGILLGKIRNDYSDIIITDISEPCSLDRCGRYYFIRNKDNAQEVVNKNWRLSNGEINYLGEWHTHPEINPKPSYIDKKLIRDSLDNNRNTPNIIFLIIVGMDASLYVGCKNKKAKKLRQLKMEHN